MVIWMLPSRSDGCLRSSGPPPPAARLKAGSTGRLKGTDYRIQSHALVEVALQGRQFQRQEYGLASDYGDKALLVCGPGPGASDWMLYTPLHPAEPLTPQQAGAIRLGQTINVDGVGVRVSELFQSTTRLVEAAEADRAEQRRRDVLFCRQRRLPPASRPLE